MSRSPSRCSKGTSLRALLSLLILTSCSYDPSTTSRSQEGEGEAWGRTTIWYDDFDEAHQIATDEGGMLFIALESTPPSEQELLFRDTLNDSRILAALRPYVLVQLDATDHPTLFPHFAGHGGFAIIDLRTPGSAAYGTITSAHPFQPLGGPEAEADFRDLSPFQPWTPETTLTILALDPGTMRNRALELAQHPAAVGTYFELIANPEFVSLSRIEWETIQITNRERLTRGVPLVSISTFLMAGARNWSAEMARTGFRHDTSGFSAENIAWGQRTPATVMRAWMESDAHRQNILNPSLKTIGMGFYTPGYYWTQRFSRSPNP